mmetsp:Transcript_5433/g.9221  ORF Transcript_5433/g.9221 Transcript_5433/m.9221 type:complete len:80 (+) Transcript_5433:242-481(+)
MSSGEGGENVCEVSVRHCFEHERASFGKGARGRRWMTPAGRVGVFWKDEKVVSYWTVHWSVVKVGRATEDHQGLRQEAA